MGLPEYENSLEREQVAEEQEIRLETFRKAVYQELVAEAEKKVKQHRGISRDAGVRRENALAALRLLKGIEKLSFTYGHTISGELVQEEELLAQTPKQTVVREKFPPGTPVSIAYPSGDRKTFLGNVGSHTDQIALQSVVNKYGRLLRAIDTKARFRARTNPS